MYSKIMVPLDGSELAECVLPHLKSFIRGFKVRDVILLRVVEPEKVVFDLGRADFQKVASDINERNKYLSRGYLDEISERLKAEGTTVHSEVLEGRVTESLIDYADKNDIDLIIIATHGRSGATRWIMGSVADKLLRSAKVPVFMVRASGRDKQ